MFKIFLEDKGRLVCSDGWSGSDRAFKDLDSVKSFVRRKNLVNFKVIFSEFVLVDGKFVRREEEMSL
jgi:hypothetical protein